MLCKLPIDPLVAQAMDEGLLEHAKVDAIAPAADIGTAVIHGQGVLLRDYLVHLYQ